MSEMRNYKRLPVILALQTVTGITLSLVRHTVSLLIRTAQNSLEKLWNDKYYIDENVLLVNMTRLKKKMKEIGIVHLLENIRGKGWKL